MNFPILGGAITVTHRADDWHASLPSDATAWGSAPTIDAAIGNLVRCHANALIAAIATEQKGR